MRHGGTGRQLISQLMFFQFNDIIPLIHLLWRRLTEGRGRYTRDSCACHVPRPDSRDHGAQQRQAQQGYWNSELLCRWTLCSMVHRIRSNRRRVLLHLLGQCGDRSQIPLHHSPRCKGNDSPRHEYSRHISERKHGIYTQHDGKPAPVTKVKLARCLSA
jgi:hypothetical protein